MKILQVQVIEGANYFSYQPVIRGVIDIKEWEEKPTKDWPGVNENLLTQLPSLQEHVCSRGKPGGFLERLAEGTLPGHVLEHVTIEVLNRAGLEVGYGKTSLLSRVEQEYEIVFCYPEFYEEAAVIAFCQSARWLTGLRVGEPGDIREIIAAVKNTAGNTGVGPSTGALLDACRQRGIPVQKLSGSLYQLGYGCYQKRICAAMTTATSCIAADIASNKQLTKKLLSDSGVPVPEGFLVCTIEEALDAWRSLGGKVTAKPCRGNQGKGVSLALESEKEIRAACRLAESYDNQIIIEENVEGENFRFLVVNGVMAAAAQRIAPFVIGDGKHSIQKLVEKENENPLRGESHESYLTKIKLDAAALMELARQNLTVQSVLPAGQGLYLRKSANLSTGASARDVTDLVHPDNAALAVYAAQVLGLDVAGVDLMLKDVTRSYKQQGGKVIEVNASPGLRMHLRPTEGNGRPVGEQIIAGLFPGHSGRIPIISVTGTNGKTTVARLIYKTLLTKGIHAGMTNTEGVYVNGEQIWAGDASGPKSARAVLRHPQVQAAVLETARGGLMRAGLGYDYADVAVITNISEDHLGQYGVETLAELVKAKSLVAEVVKRQSCVVLNLDDPHAASLAKRTCGRVIYFTKNLKNRELSRHLSVGGTGVAVYKGKIVVCTGGEVFSICFVNQIPITLKGKADHNIENVLAAAGACWALGFSVKEIKRVFESFGAAPCDNPGRLEIHTVDNITVVLDYGHNPASIRETLRTLKKMPHKKIISCVGVPGDRPNDIIRQAARAAAAYSHVVYLKEDRDLRGRKPGEAAAVMEAALAGSHYSSVETRVVLEETKALTQACQEAQPGDMVVIFYEEGERLREMISANQKKYDIIGHEEKKWEKAGYGI